MLKTLGKVVFSTGYQNPKFTPQDNKGQDYEVRTYQTTNWVSTKVTGMEQESALSTCFNRLFKYIQGNNENKVKVEMTSPVTSLMNSEEGSASDCCSVTMSFYVPEENQTDPPKPSDSEIFIENRKEFTVFVRTYGGFANAQNTHDELLKLTESLKRDGVAFKEASYYRVGYDSPFKLVNRRNEVWLIKQD